MASAYRYLKIENVAGLRKLIISNVAKRNALNIEAYNELTGGYDKSETHDYHFNSIRI